MVEYAIAKTDCAEQNEHDDWVLVSSNRSLTAENSDPVQIGERFSLCVPFTG